jgi:hypothetical protein
MGRAESMDFLTISTGDLGFFFLRNLTRGYPRSRLMVSPNHP